MPDEVRTEILRQISRLERTAPDSMEAGVLRNYVEWILALPWGIHTDDNLDIIRAKQILDEDHYGLKEVKERILGFYLGMQSKKDGRRLAHFVFHWPSRHRQNIAWSINCP